MLKKINYKYNLLLLLIPAIFTSFFPGKIIIVGALCMYPIFFILWRKYYRLNDEQSVNIKVIQLFIGVNALIFLHGLIDLKSSQDFSVTFGSMLFILLLFPLYIYSVNSKSFIYILKNTLIFILPLCFITYLFRQQDGFMTFPNNISFVYLFLLFIPFVKLKWKLFFIGLAVLGITYDITRRSFLINVTVALFIVLIVSIFQYNKLKKIFRILFFPLVISPFVLLVLGLLGVFNIFKIGENSTLKIGDEKGVSRDALVDSRSSIYADVFSELYEKKAFLIGLGGNGKTKTSLLDNLNQDFSSVYKEGRRATESVMLNYFQWGGILGALSFWLLLVVGAYNAIFKSKNKLMMMLGLFITFKVIYAFVEDRVGIRLASYFYFYMIGMCYNVKFLNLSDKQVKYILQKVFK